MASSSSSFIYIFPAIVRDPQSSALFRLLCMTRHSFRNVIPVDMNVFYSDSKTDLRLRRNCIRISSYSRVPMALLLDWWLYVVCYYPTTPTDYPSTTRGMFVGTSVAVNIEFSGHLRFFSISFVWIIWVQYATPTTFLVNNETSLHRPVLIFQPTVNPRASNNQSKQCQNSISELWKMRSYIVRIYIRACGGVQEVEGYILAPEWKPELQGSCSIAVHSSLPNRSEQNSSKLRHTVCNHFSGHPAI